MKVIKRILAAAFLFLMVIALWQCARRGNPTGGPKDVTPPELIKAEPENLTTNFKAEKIRLYFDEYIRVQDIQNQLIVSPPLKYQPEISPQGAASKYVQITIKDTLRENTTYTLNFGQSIVDNNESNPNPFLTYVFSTGDYIDSLTVSGVVKDAFNKEADQFISVMLYEIDTAFTDSTIYKSPPNYLTNTLDSTVIFTLKNLKPGKYAMIGLKDEGKNNVFDQKIDKIAFLKDTVNLPTDSIFLLNLFKEIPDYDVAPPSYAASNKIIFGYFGKEAKPKIESLTSLPDTVRTLVTKEPEKDSLNYWFTPFEADSILFTIANEEMDRIDTFTVKTRKLVADSLQITSSHGGSLGFDDKFYLAANTPIVEYDSTKISIMNQDSLPVSFDYLFDSVYNRLNINFEKEANQRYLIDLLPGAITDFFEETNDTLRYQLSTGSYADFGNLRLNLSGGVQYPMILQLTDEQGITKREIYATEPKEFEFNNLNPGNYLIRIIFDNNGNGEWDTGNYLRKEQPERVIYYPQSIEMRANWEKIESFTISG